MQGQPKEKARGQNPAPEWGRCWPPHRSDRARESEGSLPKWKHDSDLTGASGSRPQTLDNLFLNLGRQPGMSMGMEMEMERWSCSFQLLSNAASLSVIVVS